MAADILEDMTPPPIPPRSSSRQQLRSTPSPVPLQPVPADMDIADVKLWDTRPLAVSKKSSILLPSTYNFRFLPGGSFKVSKWKALYPPESCTEADIANTPSLKLPPLAPHVELPDQKLQPVREIPADADVHISEKEISTTPPISNRPLLARFATQTKHLYESFWIQIQHKDHFEVLSHETEKAPQLVSGDRSCFGGLTFTSIGHYIQRLFERTTPPTNDVQEFVDHEDEDTATIKIWWTGEPSPADELRTTSNVQEVSAPWAEGRGQGYHRRFERLENQHFGQDFRESLGMVLPD